MCAEAQDCRSAHECCVLMQAALATLIGTAGSWVYLRLLMEDMDSISESTVAPFRHAQAQPQGPARLVLQGFATYRCAVMPLHLSMCHMLSEGRGYVVLPPHLACVISL